MYAFWLRIPAASADHKDSRCFMCIISSHGDWDEDGTGVSDVVCATNGVVHIKTLTNAISPRNAPTLDNKPKIFLLQVDTTSAHIISRKHI